ncbi:Fc.00g027520.m01.CDS01 [Cosmosporella sp. VM-42]
MSTPEARAKEQARDRVKAIALREKECKDVDLVAKALEDPGSLSQAQRLALLGGPAYPEDAYGFLSALDGFRARRNSCMAVFKSYAAGRTAVAIASPQLCKFTLCDWRVPPGFETGQDANVAVDALYEEQLRLEREQDQLEKARAAVRTLEERRARFKASKTLAQHQAATEAGQTLDPSGFDSVLRPKMPDWVNSIFSGGEDYGFIIYESREAYRRPLMAKETWKSVFNERERRSNFGGYYRARRTVFQGGLLGKYMLPSWVDQCLLHQPSEVNPLSIRQHFRELWDSIHAPKPGIRRDTFLVLTNDCLFPELDSYLMAPRNELDDNEYLVPLSPSQEPKLIEPSQLPNFYLWAYDANWQPPSVTKDKEYHGTLKDQPQPNNNQMEAKDDKGKQIDHGYREGIAEAACTCNGLFAGDANTVWADEDGYEGRVKVSIHVIFSWFYYARLKGYDMKQLWRKAQTLPHQTWTCRADAMDYTKPGELI